jgi:BTB/POZ domain
MVHLLEADQRLADHHLATQQWVAFEQEWRRLIPLLDDDAKNAELAELLSPTTAETAHKKLTSALDPRYGATVTILVGREEIVFSAHAHVLCRVSAYFKAALEGWFAETHTKKLTLPEQSALVFREFLTWAYSLKSLDINDLLSAQSSITHPPKLIWKKVAELSAFAWYIQSPKLSNEIVEAVWRFLRTESWIMLTKPPVTHFVWDYTPKGCGLQKLFIALYVWKRHATHVDETHGAVLWSQEHSAREWMKRFPDDFCIELQLQGNKRATNVAHDPFDSRVDKNPFRDF